ncbi:hypothetical protein DFH08DRAFT_676077, partial [Mycena albidolilacea]
DVKIIDSMMNTFMDENSWLMQGLTLVQEVVPYVGVAVKAFKFVIKYDTTRRQNDKKVFAVKVQIQNLAVVLLRLTNIHEQDGRFMKIMQDVANDITKCGNAIEVYLKKSWLSRTAKSGSYESLFKGFILQFANYRSQIDSALNEHTAILAQDMNSKLDEMGKKMDAYFLKNETPRERDVRQVVEKSNGPRGLLANDALLQEVIMKSGDRESLELLDPGKDDPKGSKRLEILKRLESLKKELAEDVEEVLKRNMGNFTMKLDQEQSKQLTDIYHVVVGGHEKIENKELQDLWKAETWKTSVKARLIVLALNDHYTAKFAKDVQRPAVFGGSMAESAPPSPVASAQPSPTQTSLPGPHVPFPLSVEDDRWTLRYINIEHLQPIVEALDADSTGFVSILEANNFCRACPPGWSVLSYLAFWAAGWQVTITRYKSRIYTVLGKMIQLVRRVRPQNVQAANTYLAGPAMRRVELLLRATRSAPRSAYEDKKLAAITNVLRIAEGKTVTAGLQRCAYAIDDIRTLKSITQSRKIERHIYPILYELLKYHCKMMVSACDHVLEDYVFDTMNTSLQVLFEFVVERIQSLEGIFKTTFLNIEQRFNNFAFGMFSLQYGQPPKTPDPKYNTILSFYDEEGYETDHEKLHPDSKLTNSQLTEDGSEVFYRPRVEMSRQNPGPLHGIWTGYLQQVTDGQVTVIGGMLELVLRHESEPKFGGIGENYRGTLCVTEASCDGNQVCFSINGGGLSARCSGIYDLESEMITGTWDNSDFSDSVQETLRGPFVLRRKSATWTRFRYAQEELQSDSDRNVARWKFAIHTALRDLQPLRLSWLDLKRRFNERRRFMELIRRSRMVTQRFSGWKPLNDEEIKELQHLKAVLRPCDARFYNAAADEEAQKHVTFDRFCDNCHRFIEDTYLVCVECMDDNYYDAIDLCSRPECREATPHRDSFIHSQSHPLVKTFRRIHDPELASVVNNARMLTDWGKQKFELVAQGKWADKITCPCCNEDVRPPCWGCLECWERDTYICMKCDEEHRTVIDGENQSHTLNHPVVWIRIEEPVPPPPSTDNRLSEIENEMLAIGSKMAGLEKKLEELTDMLRGFGDKLSHN